MNTDTFNVDPINSAIKLCNQAYNRESDADAHMQRVATWIEANTPIRPATLQNPPPWAVGLRTISNPPPIPPFATATGPKATWDAFSTLDQLMCTTGPACQAGDLQTVLETFINT